MKRIRLLAMVLTLSLLLGMWVVPARAATAEGTCGDDIVWKVDGNQLTITGTGPMYDYSPENRPPWYDYMADQAQGTRIHYVYISEGITRIGDYAFQYDTKYIFTFELCVGKDVKEVGHYSFATRQATVVYLGDCPQIAEDAYVGNSQRQYYYYGWDTSDLQSYGGEISWIKGNLEFTTDTKTIYNLGEQLKPEDFAMVTNEPGKIVYSYTYPAKTLETEPYDNSVPGGKCVKVTVDGREFTHHYYVTNGISDCRDLKIQAIPAQKYKAGAGARHPQITVLTGDGNYTLIKDTHYRLSYSNNTEVGTATVKVTGLGSWAGIEKEATFAIVKQDIAEVDCSPSDSPFLGMPVDINITPKDGSHSLSPVTHYVLDAENCINIGDSICRVIGVGNYYGMQTVPFKITNTIDKVTKVKGAYNGTIDGTLTEDYYYEEVIQTPGVATFQANTVGKCYVFYQLYKMVGQEQVLVASLETDYGYSSNNQFTYDFSGEYEGAFDEGGAIYLLGCSWVDSSGGMYTGVQVLYVPAKVPDATKMVIEEMTDTRDFRYVYLSAYGPDGNTGILEWTSSDPDVAEVSMGTVTMKKPGTVTITARYNDLTASYQVTAEQCDLKEASIVYYDTKTQKIQVVYDNILLEEGTDYTVHTEIRGDTAEVTVIGQGLFAGQLVQQFDAVSGQPVSEKHSFDHCGDLTCNTCSETRESAHKPAELWKKNGAEHWHICQVCGKKTDVAAHTLLPADETVCTVCGDLVIPGDVDENYEVNTDDVIALLLHVSMPAVFPVDAEVDFNGDGGVTTDDVIALLLYVSMPEMFPLPTRS